MEDAWSVGEVITMGPLRVRTVGQARSTQEELWAVRRWAEEGSGLAAASQTDGEGRKGSRWLSPEGGVYFSVLVGRGLAAADADVLGQAAALAVLHACGEFLKADELFLKWPNDVVTWGPHGRIGKLSGVLVRLEMEGGRVVHAVVGVGVNVGVAVERLRLGTKGVAAVSLEGLSKRRGVAWSAPRTKVLEWVVGWFGVLLARALTEPDSVRREYGRALAQAPLTARVPGVAERLRPLGVERGGALAVRRRSGRRATVALEDAERLVWSIAARPKRQAKVAARGRSRKRRRSTARAGAARAAPPRSNRVRTAPRASRSKRR